MRDTYKKYYRSPSYDFAKISNAIARAAMLELINPIDFSIVELLSVKYDLDYGSAFDGLSHRTKQEILRYVLRQLIEMKILQRFGNGRYAYFNIPQVSAKQEYACNG